MELVVNQRTVVMEPETKWSRQYSGVESVLRRNGTNLCVYLLTRCTACAPGTWNTHARRLCIGRICGQQQPTAAGTPRLLIRLTLGPPPCLDSGWMFSGKSLFTVLLAPAADGMRTSKSRKRSSCMELLLSHRSSHGLLRR
jgi:hypothetical protein